jgi:hypothetical protein
MAYLAHVPPSPMPTDSFGQVLVRSDSGSPVYPPAKCEIDVEDMSFWTSIYPNSFLDALM